MPRGRGAWTPSPAYCSRSRPPSACTGRSEGAQPATAGVREVLDRARRGYAADRQVAREGAAGQWARACENVSRMSSVILQDLDALKRRVTPHLRLAREASIFGSVARGEADEWRDLDLVIVADTARPFLRKLKPSAGSPRLEASSRSLGSVFGRASTPRRASIASSQPRWPSRRSIISAVPVS